MGIIPFSSASYSYIAGMKTAIYLSIISVLLSSCSTSTEPKETEIGYEKGNAIDSVHTRFGTPKDDTPNNDNIFQRPQYIFSYDNSRNTTNWVAWELSDSWYGDEPRYEGTFKTDPLLPDSWYKVRHDDYTHSGYDRGHLVRSEERTLNGEDNFSTFYTTNILPMTPDLNRGPWLDLEYELEEYLKENPDVRAQVYSGGIFTTDSTIMGKGVVPVPDTLWKAVYLYKHEGFAYDNAVAVIGVKMPNIQGIRSVDWQDYTVVIDAIEDSTGYDLFISMIGSIEDRHESAEPFWQGVYGD